MESRVVNDEFQNRFGIPSEKAINYIKEYFKVNLEKFKLIEEYDDVVYFGATYKFNNNTLKVGGGRGYLELGINLEGRDYNLFDYFTVSEDYIIVNEHNLDIVFKLLLEFLKIRNII